MRRLLVALLAVVLTAPAFAAVQPDEMLKNPALEARAERLGSQLRCLVCQNELIEESNADLAHDLRVIIRKHIVEGQTDAQIKQFLVQRYGDFILLKPPVMPATYLLWFGPLSLLALGGLLLVLYVRRRRTAEGPDELSPEERQRLATLLAESRKGNA